MVATRSVPTRLTTQVVLAALLAAVALPAAGTAAMATTPDEGPSRLLVTYDRAVDAKDVAGDLGRFSTASVVDDVDVPSPVQVVDTPDAASAAALEQRLAQRDGVLAVERDVRLTLDDSSSPDTTTADSTTDTTATTTADSSTDTSTFIATDTTTADSTTGTTDTATFTTTSTGSAAWGIDNFGQSVNGTAGKPSIDIGTTQAWPTTTGSQVVVAVIDTAIDIGHPLLRDRIWRNPDEQQDGRDTDGNGYIDDLHGWNFADDSPRVSISPERDAHGTHVAGIVAGQYHADSGFRGVAPDARIMALPFIDDSGGGWASEAIMAIRYAVDNGADVINASWGGPDYSTALRTAIATAGIPVVSSAGNTGQSHEDLPVYPAAYGLANQLSVAAIEHTGRMASYSATSRNTVDLAAPGSAIVSTLPERKLGFGSGTSAAAPFVAGAVALAIQANPGLSAEQVVEVVRAGVRPLPGAQETSTGGIARAGGALAAAGGQVRLCVSDPTSPFTDVPRSHTHHRGVACMSLLKVTSGVTAELYGAEQDLRRDQVAALVARTLDRAGLLPPVPTSSKFDDIDDSIHREPIEALASVGVVHGETATRFAPKTVVSRGEFAGIVARAADYAAGAASRTPGPDFSDIATSPYREGILTAASQSLVSGHADGTFDPDRDVRRDQAASMLVRLLDRLYQQGLLDAA